MVLCAKMRGMKWQSPEVVDTGHPALQAPWCNVLVHFWKLSFSRQGNQWRRERRVTGGLSKASQALDVPQSQGLSSPPGFMTGCSKHASHPWRSVPRAWPNPQAWRSVCAWMLSRDWLLATSWTVACQPSLSIRFSRQQYGVVFHFLLQEIFPTQGWNPHLLHWQTDSLPLYHPGSPGLKKSEFNGPCIPGN